MSMVFTRQNFIALKCKNCKFWEPFASGNHGGCNKEDKITDESFNVDREKDFDVLVYSYYEGGGFWTGKDFGCVHFQQKEAK